MFSFLVIASYTLEDETVAGDQAFHLIL